MPIMGCDNARHTDVDDTIQADVRAALRRLLRVSEEAGRQVGLTPSSTASSSPCAAIRPIPR